MSVKSIFLLFVIILPIFQHNHFQNSLTWALLYISFNNDFVSSSCEETSSSDEIQIEENDYAPTDEEIDSTIVPTEEVSTIVPTTETEEESPSSDDNLSGIAEEKTSPEVFSSGCPCRRERLRSLRCSGTAWPFRTGQVRCRLP